MPWDLTIELEDRPGTLADLGAALGEAGINIDGICGFPSEGMGVMHVLVDNADGASSAIESAGLTIRGRREVLVATVDDRPGILGDVARRFADAGVNIDLIYLATGTRIVLGVDNMEAGQELV
jgi:hypothetical protein